MTVYITGDVHHRSLQTRDQSYLDMTEVDAAIKYADIAAEYDVPVTLFLTGKCVEEEREKVRELADRDNVEIGGHNYYAFETLFHQIFWKIFDSPHGPRWIQNWEIKKTITALGHIDVDVTSWRDHAFQDDSNTCNLLSKHGISILSDRVSPEGEVYEDDELVDVPINTPPDHEHVYHSFVREENHNDSTSVSPFGNALYESEEWVNVVIDYIFENERYDRSSTVLAHPACMQIADGMTAFASLCSEISKDHNPQKISNIKYE